MKIRYSLLSFLPLRSSLFLLATTAFVLFFQTSSLTASTGGPDTHGYTFKDRGETDGPLYQWIDIASTGTKVISSGDNASSNASAPQGIGRPVKLGHPFTFYGVTYDDLVPAIDGYISTELAETGSDNSLDCPLPTEPSHGKGARIYAHHKNWEIVSGGGVYYQYFRESPHPHAGCGVSVFSWVGVRPSGTTGGIASTFQVLLFDSGDILVQNLLVLGTHIGDAETVGIQNVKYTSGLAYGCPTPLANNADSKAILFELIGVNTTVAPLGAKVIHGSSSKVENQTVVYDKPLTIIGSDFSHPLLGTVRYGVSYEGCTIVIDGVKVNIFDAHIRSSPNTAIRVINGGHLHLCDSSVLGSGEHAIVVEQGSRLTMRRTEVSDPKPRSDSHIILGKAAKAEIFKSIISESWGDGIEFASVGASSAPDLAMEQSCVVRNRGNGLSLSDIKVHFLQCSITDNLGIGISAKSALIETNSCNVTTNRSGGFLLDGSSVLTTDHTIVAGNRSAVTGFIENFVIQGSASVSSGGSNLTDGAASFLNTTGDQTNTNPKLTPLGGYGERVGAASPKKVAPLMSQLALHNSPVIDASMTTPSVDTSGIDLRNQPRLANGDNTGGSVLDIGATEAPGYITVTTAADENHSPAGANISLREALIAANGERVVFAAGLNGQTINLGSTAGGQGSGLGATNSQTFVDASSLANGIIISGGGELDSPLIGSPKLLHGLTLTQGRWSAIRNFNGTLVLSACKITNNTQQDAQITQPYGSNGGGIFNGDVAFITDCIFEGNYCSNEDDSFAVGGGFATFPSAGTGNITGSGISYLIGCRFEDNTADVHSGGLYTRGGRKTIIDGCTFIDNTAEGVAGARVSASQSDDTYLDITRSSFIRNTALTGGTGGLSITGTSTFNPADEIIEEGTISYCTFDGNLVGAANYGAMSVSAIEVDIEHCTITNNKAELSGGIGILTDGIVNMRNTILDNNLSTFNAQFTTSNLTLVGNGAFVSLGHNLTGDNLTTFNHSSDLTNSPPLLAPITRSSVSVPTRHPLHGSPAINGGTGNGFAIDARGYPGKQGSRVDIGAVETGLPVIVTTEVDEFHTPSGTNVSLREALRDAREGSRVIFSTAHIPAGSTIDLRTAATGQGTPLETSKNLVVDATMIDRGVTIHGAGAGLRCLTLPDGDQTFSLHGVSFRDGEAGTNGSAIHKGLHTDLTITHSAIYDSFSSNNAAAIHANGGTLTLENVTLSGNGSTKGGSAISGRNGAKIALRHSTVFANTITTTNFPGGAAIFLETNASLECNHVAMGDNLNTSNLNVRNLLRFGATTVGDVFFTQIDDSTIPSATNVGAIKLRTLQQAGGLARTCPPDIGSPVVNAGYAIFSGSPPSDARGFARKYGPKVDIGAYELGSFIAGTTDPPVDIDNDGMDYYWEEFYGLIPGTDDSGTDSDGDDLSALGEYLSQTNPGVFDPIEPLKVVDFDYDPNTGRVWLTFSSTPGIAYSVWHSATLAPGSLSNIVNVFGATGGTQTLVIIESSSYGGGTKGFFRVERP